MGVQLLVRELRSPGVVTKKKKKKERKFQTQEALHFYRWATLEGHPEAALFSPKRYVLYTFNYTNNNVHLQENFWPNLYLVSVLLLLHYDLWNVVKWLYRMLIWAIGRIRIILFSVNLTADDFLFIQTSISTPPHPQAHNLYNETETNIN